MKNSFLDELNENQRRAVEFIDGPSLVVAGAGSGKTRVLTYKIAYLLTQGVKPSSILALTFTNKASREMKERINTLVGGDKARYLWMGTFHSVFYRILRAEAEAIGFKPNFTIYDSSDSKSLIKSIIKEMQLDDKVYKASTVAGRISRAKNYLQTFEDYASDPEAYKADKAQRIPSVRDIYRIYAHRCKQANVMDFDDLLLYTHKLLATRADICKQYADRFEYILVDEYQDTNVVQHRIVWELSKANCKICVVGDDAQSIYGFRGAKIDNILRFCEQYGGAQIFKLEQNYRSTQNIVNAANSVISHNKGQIPKNVFSKNDVGQPIILTSAYSDIEEGEIVCNQISRLRSVVSLEYSDIAILYRTNAQSRIFEEALRKRAIPYKIYGGLSFYQRKEIKDIVGYFRLIINPADGEAFKRTINTPARGIGDTTLSKLTTAAVLNGVSLWEVVENLELYDLKINKGTISKLNAFREMIQSFLIDADKEDVATLAARVVKDTGIMADFFKDNSPEGLNRIENVTELMNGIRQFVDSQREEGYEDNVYMADYMQQVSLLTDTEKDNDDVPRITLMTIHSAKGLEFKSVFVVGLEDGLLPNSCATYDPSEKEEERRLFYVAITRAKEYCYLSYSQSRYHYGKMEFSNPSCFLRDIDSRYIQTTQPTFGKEPHKSKPVVEVPFRPKPLSERATASRPLARNRPSSSMIVLEVGQRVEHERFGVGEVLCVEGEGENSKATVMFENAGQKNLLLKFAHIKVID